MTAINELLRNVVDYAGLFPPAGLTMDAVVKNYALYVGTPQAEMLGRLIVPTSRLDEFLVAANDLDSDVENPAPWLISALLPPIELGSTGQLQTSAFDNALATIAEFNAVQNKHETAYVVDTIEVKTSSPESAVAIIDHLPDHLNSFLEVNWNEDPEPLIFAISKHKKTKPIFAKIRTGAITPELIPSPNSVARFIACCARHRVGFKATAGLHHPIRANQKLTYENDSPTARMHGFLNVFIGTVFAFALGLEEPELTEILANEDPNQFVFEKKSLNWKASTVSLEQIIQVRDSGIISFGSCSFTEPTVELLDIPGQSYQSIF